MSEFSWPAPESTTAAQAPAVVAETERDAYGVDILFNGDKRLNAKGDYILTTGVDNLKARIFRRLITNPGEYKPFPNYGVGVERYVKKRMSQSVIDSLKLDIVRNLESDNKIEEVKEVNVEKTTFGNDTGLKIFVSVVSLGKERQFSYDISGSL